MSNAWRLLCILDMQVDAASALERLFAESLLLNFEFLKCDRRVYERRLFHIAESFKYCHYDGGNNTTGCETRLPTLFIYAAPHNRVCTGAVLS